MSTMWPQPTTTKELVPLLFHEPHVNTGFRPCHQSWTQMFLSLFQWHNEVMNVWTHVAGLVMVLVYSWSLWQEFHLVSDAYMWPLSVGIITMYLLYLCSSGAHLFQNRSELTHYTCFMCDYAGIGLYGFGSTMIHYWYCLHEDFLGSLSHQLAIPVGVLLAVIVCICCSIAKTKYKRPYPFVRRLWQMFSVLAIYVWLNLPIWYRLGLYLYDGKWESSFSHHIQQMSWFTLGGFFFGSDIPQRFLPGKFDIIGHSHQLFHVCIVMTTYEQLNAAYVEITDGINSIHRMAPPTFLETWGMLGLVMAANACVVYVFHFTVYRRLLEEGRGKKTDDIADGENHLRSAEKLAGKDVVVNGGSYSNGGSVHGLLLSDGGGKSSPVAVACDSNVHLRSGAGSGGDESPSNDSSSS